MDDLVRDHKSSVLTETTNNVYGSMDEDPFDQRLAAQQLSDTQLLRECLYALQGLEGDQIRFWEGDDNGFDVEDPAYYKGIRLRPSTTSSLNNPKRQSESLIGSGAVDAFRICGEAGWLYKRVQKYVDEVQSSEGGVVSRALAAALSNEIGDYLALLASFESRLQESPLRLTLRQLLVEMRMPTVRLKTLAMLTDGLSHLKGGRLLSALHHHTIHGDTRHKVLVQSMVYSASQPWFDILYHWTMTGTLSDPHDEFFITEQPSVNDEMMWHDGYKINRDNIPIGILERDLVRPSLIVGKGINFIRRCLLDTEWTLEMHDEKEATTETVSSEEDIKLRLGYHFAPAHAKRRACPDGYYVSPLHRTLAHAAHQVHSHILESLHEQHHLIQHLWALKQFFFLGQGDFITALMDGLHQDFELRDGISGIYAGSLMTIVDGALRSTNAMALPPYTRERLCVELLMDDKDYTFGPGRGTKPKDEETDVDLRSGWDIFMLTYDIPPPLKAIVHPKAMTRYKLIFSLLFRLKRVEYMLNATWRQSTTLHHALFSHAQYLGMNLTKSTQYRRTTAFLRKVCLARQSMLHFVGNLQSYLMIEVLEGGWKELLRNIKAAKTLDEVIHAHDKYLEHVVRKSFLHEGSVLGSHKKHSPRDTALALQLDHLLDIARTFCTLQERMFTDALEELEAATKQVREDVPSAEAEGEWGFAYEEDVIEGEHFFGLADDSMTQKVVRVSEEFDETFLKVQSGLHETVNGSGLDDSPLYSPVSTPTGTVGFEGIIRQQRNAYERVELDVDSLRFLTFRLDYSSFYSNRAPP